MKKHQLNCEEISNLLPALCFDELVSEQANEIHDHLPDCEQCMEEYLALAMALQKSKAPLQEDDLMLTADQRSEIRKSAWAAELKIENQSVAQNLEEEDLGRLASQGKQKRKFPWATIAAVLVVGFVLSAMILPSLGTARNKAVAKSRYNEYKQELMEVEMEKLALEEKVDELSRQRDSSVGDSLVMGRSSKAKRSKAFNLPPPPPPPPPAEADFEEAHEKVNLDVSDSVVVSGGVADVYDEPPAAEIMDDRELISDVKPSTSPLQSSKMYSARSASAKKSAIKRYGVAKMAKAKKSGDEDVDIFSEDSKGQSAQLLAMKEKLEEYQIKSEELELNLEEANGEINELKNTVGKKDTEIARIERQVELLTPDEDAVGAVDGFADDGFEDTAFNDVDSLFRSSSLVQEEEQQVMIQRDLSKIKSRETNLPSVSLPSPLFFEGMTDTTQTNLSTFSIDVDTASYTAARAEIRAGRKVDANNVRMEEFINSFDYHYRLPKEEAFNIDCELADHKVFAGVKILRVGVQGQRLGADSKKPGSYTFVIDNSGSMAAENRLPLIQKTLPKMFKAMNENDEVTILTCENRVNRLANKLPAGNHKKLAKVVEDIEAGAVANLSMGIEEAYKLASQNFRSGAVNRVILLSDGIASLGEKEAQQVLQTVDQYRKQGIANTVIGVGSEDFDDSFLETLANRGDGAYYFGDSKEGMQEILVNNFDASFKTIARDVKIQLDFDPKAVRSYRLLGYENRRLANKDFRNDKVDAGEIGAGQSVTALYELVLHEQKSDGQLATVNLRYKNLENELVTEINSHVKLSRDQAFSQSQTSTRLAWCVATFARLLKNDGKGEIRFDQLAAEVDRIRMERPQDKKIQELKDLIIRCQSLY
ncbi:von Willebrand factor type A domain-containing protein [Lentisphaera marina]|uniref:YfbK domain-containing protein n=1 Tax=Lentisphaera marina TaxID=1111041 RepID=UPI0023663C44|nr:von Willebrand factor type A domain-containing protein [Lentisphaera marina]MDD7986839.1 von Willebrand factor type A domain-containing protein [Lentisphaera marina]